MPRVVGFYAPHGERRKARNSFPAGENINCCEKDVNSISDKSNNREEGTEVCKELQEEVEGLSLEENSCETQEEESKQTRSDKDEEVDSDEEGWITPENFQQACEEMGGVMEELPQSLAVGCITTDFAMQVWSLVYSS